MNRQTNESDFIVRCPTDVERPTSSEKAKNELIKKCATIEAFKTCEIDVMSLNHEGCIVRLLLFNVLLMD